MPLRACVLIEQDFHDLEAWYPIYRLREAGLVVDIVGRPGTGPTYKGRYGYPGTATHDTSQVQDADYAVVVIPGGWAPDKLRMDPGAVALVARAMARGKLVAAICHGGSLLVDADCVDGRHLTSWPSIRRDLEAAGGLWQDAEVVVDGNLITARKPDDLPAWMRQVVAWLGQL